MRELTQAEIAAAGVTYPTQQMENGQRRFRLNTKEGAGYIVLYAGPVLAWDRSHSHLRVREIVHVFRGQVAFAFMDLGQPVLKIVREGESLTLEPSPPHCLLMDTGSILQVMKIANDPSRPDWVPCPQLDELLRHFDPELVFRGAIGE